MDLVAPQLQCPKLLPYNFTIELRENDQFSSAGSYHMSKSLEATPPRRIT